VKAVEHIGKKVIFCAFIDKSTQNIARKIEEYCEGLNVQGYCATPYFITAKGFLNRLKKSLNLLFNDADILILRNSVYTPFLLLILLKARFNGKKIVIEMPSPMRVMVHEVWESDRNVFYKLTLITLFYLLFPYSLWPAHRILNYSDESDYFLFGIKQKNQLTTNGIHTGPIPVKEFRKNHSTAPFTFIGVAMFQPSHGYDRMIRSIHAYKKTTDLENQREILFYLVGDGSPREEWELLVKELSLTDSVIFTGVKTGNDLNSLFSQINVAIGKLAPYKIHLDLASELKLRGYCARGVPFIKSYNDPDFPDELDFVYQVKNSDTLIDIQKIIEWFDSLDHENLSNRMRQYAEENLDYRNKELLYL